MKRRLVLILLTLASFVPASLLMGALVPWPSEYGVRSKWDWWVEHKQDYDAVFVGSSVTAYGLIPPGFDGRMEEHGYQSHSFNLGIGGMTRFEADHMVRAVLAEAPPNLKYIFIEVSSWNPRIYPTRFTFSPRMLYWHTPEMTLDTLRACAEMPAPAKGEDWRLDSAKIHTQLMLDKLTGKGQGPRLVSALLGLDKDELLPSDEDLAVMSGYVDLDHIEGENWDKWRANFLAGLKQYTERVRAIPAANAAQIPLEGHRAIAWFQKQIDAAHAAGVEPIFYFGPYASSSPLPYRLAEAGLLPVFLGFNQPDKYPMLYRFENHFDENHLSRRGAEIFSKMMADGFAEYLAGKGQE